MSEFVVWFDSSETGAPVLNNTAGSLIGVLDACLITGFNTKAITSITVADGVATATCNGHGFSGVYGKNVLISGATPAALNGRKELTFVDTNTFRFATTAANGAATGTITAKRDPLGWVKQFAGVNKAIYKRTELTATSMMLRINDTGSGVASATDARVLMIESATDIDTVQGVSPPNANVTNGYIWNKGSNSTIGKQWTLIGDGKTFYLTTQSGTQVLPNSDINANASMLYSFGDFETFKQGDAYGTLISGETSSSSGGGTSMATGCLGQPSGGMTASAAFGIAAARSFSQLGGSISLTYFGISRSFGMFVFPSPVDSGYLVNPKVILLEAAPGGSTVRGLVRGLAESLGYNSVSHLEIVDSVVGLSGRRLLGLQIYAGGPTRILLDITGPWG